MSYPKLKCYLLYSIHWAGFWIFHQFISNMSLTGATLRQSCELIPTELACRFIRYDDCGTLSLHHYGHLTQICKFREYIMKSWALWIGHISAWLHLLGSRNRNTFLLCFSIITKPLHQSVVSCTSGGANISASLSFLLSRHRYTVPLGFSTTTNWFHLLLVVLLPVALVVYPFLSRVVLIECMLLILVMPDMVLCYLSLQWEVHLKHLMPINTSLNSLCIPAVVFAHATLSVSPTQPATKYSICRLVLSLQPMLFFCVFDFSCLFAYWSDILCTTCL